MTAQYQTILGALAALVGLVGYIPYYRDTLRGRTKPHPFSWVIFTLLLGITFFAQAQGGAGPGAWVSGVSTLGVGGVTLLAFTKGERTITRFDWICFAGAFGGIWLWHDTSDPLAAVTIVTIVNLVAFVPTWRKAYHKPHEETLSFYMISTVKYLISIFALSSFNAATALFPTVTVASNLSFVTMLVLRRRHIV